MSQMSDKTLRCYDDRDKRNRNSHKCFTYRCDRFLRINNNSYNGNKLRLSVETLTLSRLEKQLKKPWILTRRYRRKYPKITINLYNNMQGINKDTQPESDKRVRHEDELHDNYNYYKIIIPDGHKYTKDYIINNLLNYVASETLVPIKYRANGNRANFLWTIKK